jgi:hypothetical protein
MEIDRATNLHLLEGCYPVETAAEGRFVWAPSRFEIRLPHDTHTVGLDLAYLGNDGTFVRSRAISAWRRHRFGKDGRNAS